MLGGATVVNAKRTKTARRIDALMERASAALQRTDYFASEFAAEDALRLAHAEHDYSAMARILLPLQEARRQRNLQAVDENVIIILEECIPVAEVALEPGCWLICPPCVGMDGRNLRDRSLDERVPMLIVTREPLTMSGVWPLVAVGPRIVRIKAKPSKDLTPGWFVDATEALADEILVSVNNEDPAWERVDDLMEALSSVPDSEKLHQALRDACRCASHDQQLEQQADADNTAPAVASAVRDNGAT